MKKKYSRPLDEFLKDMLNISYSKGFPGFFYRSRAHVMIVLLICKANIANEEMGFEDICNIIPKFITSRSTIKTILDTGSSLNLVITDEDGPKVASAATAIVSDTGTISLSLNNSGMGYTAAPTVSISTYFGVTVSAASTAEVSAGGTVTKLYVNNAGAGYTNTSVPMVLIGQPTGVADTLGTPVLTGDFGIIAGVAATSVGTAKTGLVLDLFTDMLMRDPVRVGTSVTLPQIEAGDFFYLHNTSVGAGAVSSYEDGNGDSVVGVGTTHLDNLPGRHQLVHSSQRATQALLPDSGILWRRAHSDEHQSRRRLRAPASD